MLTHVVPGELTQVWEKAVSLESFVTPFYSYAWHTTWLGYLAQEYTFIPLVYKGTLFPLMRNGSHLTLGGDENVTDYMDAIGSNEHKAAGWTAILDYAKSEHIETITLNNVPAVSSTVSFFQNLPQNNGFTVKISEEDTTPWMSLPTDWESYVSTLERKDRHELRRKLRKFEREHPTTNFSVSDSPDNDIGALITLMKNDPAKLQFLTEKMEKFFGNIVRNMKDTVHILRLTDENTTIAAVLCFIYNRTLFLYNSGFNEASYSGAGFYIKAMSIKYAIEASCTTYNFLQGKERYKYELGAKDSAVFRIDITVNA